MTSAASGAENVTVPISPDASVLFSVTPDSGVGGDTVQYAGQNLNDVTRAAFKDSTGHVARSSAEVIGDGDGATAAVPSGMKEGTGKTWLEEADSTPIGSLTFKFAK